MVGLETTNFIYLYDMISSLLDIFYSKDFVFLSNIPIIILLSNFVTVTFTRKCGRLKKALPFWAFWSIRGLAQGSDQWAALYIYILGVRILKVFGNRPKIMCVKRKTQEVGLWSKLVNGRCWGIEYYGVKGMDEPYSL